jgi:uracil-DNA glycosylase
MTNQGLAKINTQIKQLAHPAKYYTGRFIPKIGESPFNGIMIIAEMPTAPKRESDWDPQNNFFLTKTDLKFNLLLNKLGLDGSFITDIVKTCAKARRPTQEEIEHFKPILLEEIEILNPKLILALGQSASEVLTDLGINHTPIWHPAYVERFNRWAEYEDQLEQIRSALPPLGS